MWLFVVYLLHEYTERKNKYRYSEQGPEADKKIRAYTGWIHRGYLGLSALQIRGRRNQDRGRKKTQTPIEAV